MKNVIEIRCFMNKLHMILLCLLICHEKLSTLIFGTHFVRHVKNDFDDYLTLPLVNNFDFLNELY